MRLVRLLSTALLLAGCQQGSSVPVPREIVDLSPVLTPDLNIQRLGTRTLSFLGTEGRIRSTPIVPADASFTWGMRTIEILSHTGAHLDAPSRLLRGGETPARVDLSDLFGPARVIDLRWHNRHTPIQITDLELKPIEEGEIVILFVGYEPPAAGEWPRYAPLSAQAAEYLTAKKIRALATDLPAIVRFDDIESRMTRAQPPEEVWAEYLPLFQAGIPIIAGLVNLDAIVKEPNVAFVGFPLALPIADGAPVRAAALVY
ncbi:MAG TPA: cyclase family protein [Candidatus Dormibacteraeota bacterium]|nr:cyclase family protein [Candidatus Dormibacteraeota bacterium]